MSAVAGRFADSMAVDAVITRIRGVYRNWRRNTPVEAMRADWDKLFPAIGPGTAEALVVGGVPCVWISAPGVRTDKAIVYFHGGGFQIGSPASHQELMGLLSAASGVRVLGVEYRLAPEHRFPAAFEDALAVLEALLRGPFSSADLAMAGDSAGGGLALAAVASLLREGKSAPAAAFVMSPLTDLAASGRSYVDRADRDPIHQRPLIEAMARMYLGADGDPRDPRASPLYTEAAVLAGFPPVLLQVGERETLVSDAELFAQRLQQAGASAELQIWPGMIHVFQQFPADLAEARDALAAGGRYIAQRLMAP